MIDYGSPGSLCLQGFQYKTEIENNPSEWMVRYKYDATGSVPENEKIYSTVCK